MMGRTKWSLRGRNCQNPARCELGARIELLGAGIVSVPKKKRSSLHVLFTLAFTFPNKLISHGAHNAQSWDRTCSSGSRGSCLVCFLVSKTSLLTYLESSIARRCNKETLVVISQLSSSPPKLCRCIVLSSHHHLPGSWAMRSKPTNGIATWTLTKEREVDAYRLTPAPFRFTPPFFHPCDEHRAVSVCGTEFGRIGSEPRTGDSDSICSHAALTPWEDHLLFYVVHKDVASRLLLILGLCFSQFSRCKEPLKSLSVQLALSASLFLRFAIGMGLNCRRMFGRDTDKCLGKRDGSFGFWAFFGAMFGQFRCLGFSNESWKSSWR